MSEALELDWRDVDLVGGRAIFWQTKSGKRRIAELPPRVVAALAELPRREGRAVLSSSGKPYWDSDRDAGGQIKTAWKGAIRRAGLDPELTPATAAIRQEMERRLHAALAELDEDDRDILLMRHFEQLSNQEVAESLGLTEAAASMRYLRAMRRLRFRPLRTWRKTSA